MTQSPWLLCYFWNKCIYSHIELLAAGASAPACYCRDTGRDGLSGSGRENQGCHEIHGADARLRLQRGANETEEMYFLWNNLNPCCALPQLPLPFFTEHYIPREVYPLNKCSRNQVLCPCHCKFVYDPGWPYFSLEKNPKNQNKDKHLSFRLAIYPSARLIIIHRADKLNCIETHYYPILETNNYILNRIYLQQWVIYAYLIA